MPFSSRPIRGTYSQHDAFLLMLTLTPWPRSCLSGVFTVQWLLPCPHCTLREEVTLHGPHLGGVVPPSWGRWRVDGTLNSVFLDLSLLVAPEQGYVCVMRVCVHVVLLCVLDALCVCMLYVVCVVRVCCTCLWYVSVCAYVVCGFVVCMLWFVCCVFVSCMFLCCACVVCFVCCACVFCVLRVLYVLCCMFCVLRVCCTCLWYVSVSVLCVCCGLCVVCVSCMICVCVARVLCHVCACVSCVCFVACV